MLRLLRVYPLLAILLFGAIIMAGGGFLVGLVIVTALTVFFYAGIGPFMSAIELVEELFERISE